MTLNPNQLHSDDAEKTVLSALIMIPARFDEVSRVVKPGDFFAAPHRVIATAIYNMQDGGMPVDLMLLKHYLESKGLLEKAGGLVGLTDLVGHGVTRATNIVHYAEIVKEFARKRLCLSIADSIRSSVAAGVTPSSQIIATADEMLMEVDDTPTTYHDMKSVTKIVYQSASKSFENGSTVGIKTGINSLDHYLTGMEGGQYIIIAGRPGTGKTSLAMNIVENVVRAGLPSLVFSVEMSVLGLGRRMAAKNSLIDSRNIKTGSLNPKDWGQLGKALENISRLPLYISDIGGLTTVQMRSIARQLHKKKSIKLIMIDYIQLMSAGKSSENRNLETTEISRSIKALAKELDVPIIALSQLSRASAARGEGAKPRLSDLRDSGALEQDADAVIFTHRPDKSGQKVVVINKVEEPSENIAEIIIAKLRDGETGSFFTRFDGAHNTFYELIGGGNSSVRNDNYYYQDVPGDEDLWL